MSAIIYTILKEYFVDIHTHPVKARIMSPVNDNTVFVFQTNLYYKNKGHLDPNQPASTFTSFANAERHLLQYLEEFQNTLDMGGDIAPGAKI